MKLNLILINNIIYSKILNTKKMARIYIYGKDHVKNAGCLPPTIHPQD